MSEQFEFDFNASKQPSYESMSLDELKDAYKKHIGFTYDNIYIPDNEASAEIILVLNNKPEIEMARLQGEAQSRNKEDIDAMYPKKPKK